MQWRTHLAERLVGLVGGVAAFSFEVFYPLRDCRLGVIGSAGFDVGALETLGRYIATHGVKSDPEFLALLRDGRPSITLTRQELIPDAEWYALPAVNDLRRHLRIDHSLPSQRLAVRQGMFDQIDVHRGWGDRPFGGRERRLVSLFHTELARLWTRRPKSAAVPVQVTDLPPRAQRVYGCLVQGDTERQAAAKLGLAPQTVHSYVKLLYRELNVSSRAELLVRYQPAYDFTPRLTTSPVTGR